MDNQLKKKVKNYMLKNIEDHTDEWGFVNCTSLAEDAAHHADGDNDAWLDDPEHEIWELAIEAEQEFIEENT